MKTHSARLKAGAGTRGFATLATVLALLALAAWGAAVSQRTLVAELRASAAHLRAAEAFEAAQGGLDFALALLRTGPIDASCLPAPLSGASVALAVEHGPVEAACRQADSGWACACAALGASASLPTGPGSSFRLTLQRAVVPGVLEVQAFGCSSAATACPPSAAAPEANGRTLHRAVSRLAMRAQAEPAGGTAALDGRAPDTVAWRRVPGSWRDF